MHSSDIVRAAQYRSPIAENIIINDIDDKVGLSFLIHLEYLIANFQSSRRWCYSLWI